MIKQNQLLQTVSIDTAVVETQIETLSSQVKDIKEQRQRKLSNRTGVVYRMTDMVVKYAEMLEVDQFLYAYGKFIVYKYA